MGATSESSSPWKQSRHVKDSSPRGFKVRSVSEPRPSRGGQCVSWGGGGASSSGQSGCVSVGSWRVIGQSVGQSLSEPTADEPFLFLFGALGFESSSSEALLEALSSSLLVGGAAPFLERGEVAGALRRDFGGFA